MDETDREEGVIKLQPTMEDVIGTLTELNSMRLSGESHDSILNTEDGGEFPVHKIVLICASDYFKALFTSTLNDRERTTIVIPGVKAETLSRIIDSAYAQTFEVPPSDIWDLVITADMLLCKSLVTKCYQHLSSNMSPTSCLQLYQHTRSYDMKDFKDAVQTYVVSNFYRIPDDSEDLMNISADALADILQDDRLSAREDNLWQVVRKWIEKTDDRKIFAAKLIGSLRLAYLDVDFVFEQIMCHPVVLNDKACRVIIEQRQDLMWRLAEVFASTVVETPYIARPRLPQDILFSIGGYDRNRQETTGCIEVYDSRADLWCQLDRGVEVPEAKRESHACVFLNDCIYVLGGEDRTTGRLHNTVNCWDLTKKRWYCVPPMKQQRCRFSAVVLCGTIIVIGGWQSNFRTLATAEQYHPRYNTWTFLESMRTNRCSSAAAILNKKVYVCGGSTNRVDNLKTVEIYNSETYTWHSAHHMNESRRGAAATAFRGNIIVAGGRNAPSIEKYDSDLDIWTRIGQMVDPRFFFTLTVLDGVLYAIGGTNGVDHHSYVYGSEAFHEETNSWRPVTSSEEQISIRATCIVRNIPDVEQYLCSNRNNLLEVKGKLVQTYKEKGDMEKAKSALRFFT